VLARESREGKARPICPRGFHFAALRSMVRTTKNLFVRRGNQRFHVLSPGQNAPLQCRGYVKKRNHEGHEEPSAAFGRNQNLLSPRRQGRKEWRTDNRGQRAPSTSTLGDLCAFARNVVRCVSKPYVILARKFAQENKILTSSSTKTAKQNTMSRFNHQLSIINVNALHTLPRPPP
jgi:hypothetical protein